jgi:hypothetical protein
MNDAVVSITMPSGLTVRQGKCLCIITMGCAEHDQTACAEPRFTRDMTRAELFKFVRGADPAQLVAIIQDRDQALTRTEPRTDNPLVEKKGTT